jgi:hypothetical protein
MAKEDLQSRYDGALIVVARLKLASWLYVNNQRLVQRQLDSLGQHVAYYFEPTAQTDSLVEQWIKKTGFVDLNTLSRYSESVSFEIRIAARLRRGETISNLFPPRQKKNMMGPHPQTASQVVNG